MLLKKPLRNLRCPMLLAAGLGALSQLRSLPKFIVIVDPKKEYTAVAEARKVHIPIIALAGSDNNLYELEYPIPGNDSSRQSIAFILRELVVAYKRGLVAKKEAAAKESVKAS